MRQQVCRRAQATAKPWMCSAVRCGVDHSLLVVGVEQTKKMDLWRVPPILVIQLKRFQFTECDTLATLVPPCAHHLTVLVIACHVCLEQVLEAEAYQPGGVPSAGSGPDALHGS